LFFFIINSFCLFLLTLYLYLLFVCFFF